MERGCPELFGLIVLRNFRMRAQIVRKGEMPLDLRETFRIAMELVGPLSGRWIVAPAIAPARKSEFAETFIAKLFDARHDTVEALQIRRHRNKIDDWFGHDAISGLLPGHFDPSPAPRIASALARESSSNIFRNCSPGR